ncbi:aromatic ring-hydroxylating dioxygenase subunit alpha [Nocardioides sp.]|uniref:aromatic ring-hydroxylating oxygenase subunit alpha n=1 Tax=Nocardioides sp. TaxID=35761 RepID=UPI002D7E5C28|nr:aromatic ring-hydroxylating dioxygenase subunit alpha [Nocardioides sp.]HET8961670.1 aromatic ring-hydroxylating dioxygenase subunit alpha [Nocardioides sp.]
MSDLADLRAALESRTGPAMLPALAYTSSEVLAWEQRFVFAGTWACLGRLDELLPPGTTQRAVPVGDVAGLLTRADARVRLFANTCRHRGHELLTGDASSAHRAIVCPYHSWSYDLAGRVLAAPGFREADGFAPESHGLVELPVAEWSGWLFGHGTRPVGDPDVPDFDAHLGALVAIVAPYRPEALRLGERHDYEVAANWKVIAENYHECYHCPAIHPELCRVSPPTSGDNYHLPGAWVGGSMRLGDGVATMSLDGASRGWPIAGVSPTTVEYLHMLPNLLVSAHPDYVMTHRLLPLAPDRTLVECSWYFPPDGEGRLPDPAYAVDFWDLTNRQDWTACESVQRGLASPHFRPGPLAPGEDAVARFDAIVAAAYLGRGFATDAT